MLSNEGPIVYDLKFVEPSEFELVAPIPEQLKTTTMRFCESSRKPAEKLGKFFPLFFVQGALKNMNFWFISPHWNNIRF